MTCRTCAAFGKIATMSGADPTGRPESGASKQERERLEFLQGMAKAPLGWPAVPPSSDPLDPAELERLLREHGPARTNSVENPWLRPRNVLIAVGLFAILLLMVILII